MRLSEGEILSLLKNTFITEDMLDLLIKLGLYIKESSLGLYIIGFDNKEYAIDIEYISSFISGLIVGLNHCDLLFFQDE